jgi:hypothetical protein
VKYAVREQLYADAIACSLSAADYHDRLAAISKIGGSSLIDVAERPPARAVPSSSETASRSIPTNALTKLCRGRLDDLGDALG